MYIRSSWLAAFIYLWTCSFIHFIYCLPRYSRLYIFYRVSNLTDLVLNKFCLFFMYALVCSLCACLSFWVLVLFDSFYYTRKPFSRCHVFLTFNVSQGSLCFALSLVGMHYAAAAAAASMWALTNSHIGHSGWVFLSPEGHRICFLMLSFIHHKHFYRKAGTTHCVLFWLFTSYSCIGLIVPLPRECGGRKTHLQKRRVPHNPKHY